MIYIYIHYIKSHIIDRNRPRPSDQANVGSHSANVRTQVQHLQRSWRAHPPVPDQRDTGDTYAKSRALVNGWCWVNHLCVFNGSLRNMI